METVFAHELDPRRDLPGGVYLDELQKQEAEVLRAKGEDREPDLENPPAIAGTPLVPVEALTELQTSVANKRHLVGIKMRLPDEGEPDPEKEDPDPEKEEPLFPLKDKG